MAQPVRSLALERHDVTSLGTGCDFNIGRTIEGVNLHVRPERGVMERNLKHTGEVVTVPAEDFVDLYCDVDENISSRTTSETNLTLTSKLETQTILDTRRNVEFKGSLCPDSALAAAVNARIWNGLTETPTSGARRCGEYVAEQ